MINKRLGAIVDWIEGSVLADVGCDHAYVAVQAVIQNKVDKAYACDIAKLPLEHAQTTIDQCGVGDKVQTILMDGIQQLPEDVDVIVIAGLGAGTIQTILQPEYLKPGVRLILSPHKDVVDLRKDVSNKPITIKRERMVYEQGHYYPILDCIVEKGSPTLTDEQCFMGVHVVKDETYRNYIHFLTKKYKRIIDKIPTKTHPEFSQHLEYLEKEKESL